MSHLIGHVYVVAFSNGILKVGFSRKRPDGRIAAAVRYAEKHFNQFEVARFVSEPHFNANRTEDALIDFCGKRYAVKPFQCEEWFVSDDFGADVIKFAKSLDVTQSTNAEFALAEQPNEFLQRTVIDVIQNGGRTLLKANDLHQIGNAIRKQKGLCEKQVGSYFYLASTQELIYELQQSENLDISDIKLSRRGKDGGTWLHPVLFIDMAMWYSPELKVSVIKWAIQKSIIKPPEKVSFAHDAVKALEDAFPSYGYERLQSLLDESISAACGVGTDEDKWQRATEQQLLLRDKIQEHIVLLADVCSSVPECVNKSIEKAKKKVFANNGLNNSDN